MKKHFWGLTSKCVRVYLLVCNTAVLCVVTQHSAHKLNRLLNRLTFRSGANINARDKIRSTSFRHPFINIIITQALTCARPCFSCTEVAVSVTSTDLLLSSVWKPQIMAANNFLKRENCLEPIRATPFVGCLSFHIHSPLWIIDE